MSEIINWLRKPQSYWLWLDIGQNQYEGPLLNLRVLLSQKDVDTFIELETEEWDYDDYELVKVKTDLNELTDSFLEKFLYRSPFPQKQIISFQRYRGKKGDRYLTTYYLFEVKAHDY